MRPWAAEHGATNHVHIIAAIFTVSMACRSDSPLLILSTAAYEYCCLCCGFGSCINVVLIVFTKRMLHFVVVEGSVHAMDVGLPTAPLPNGRRRSLHALSRNAISHGAPVSSAVARSIISFGPHFDDVAVSLRLKIKKNNNLLFFFCFGVPVD